jgi:hypothetical protein
MSLSSLNDILVRDGVGPAADGAFRAGLGGIADTVRAVRKDELPLLRSDVRIHSYAMVEVTGPQIAASLQAADDFTGLLRKFAMDAMRDLGEMVRRTVERSLPWTRIVVLDDPRMIDRDGMFLTRSALRDVYEGTISFVWTRADIDGRIYTLTVARPCSDCGEVALYPDHPDVVTCSPCLEKQFAESEP